MNKEDLIQIIKEIGLSESETKVYLALLKLKDSTRGDIVNKSQIAGSKIYEILEKLQEKGLVSIYTKDKIKHFKANNPNQILTYLEEKKEKVINIEKQIKNILPDLLLDFNSKNNEQEVELLTGFKGLQEIFREQIELMKKNETCYVIGGTRSFEDDHIYQYFRKIHKLRKDKNIKTKMLYNIEQKKTMEKFYPKEKFPEVDIKYLKHNSPVAINIYQDRTIIIIFGKKINLINIKSSDIANSFLEYFNILWKEN